MTCWTTASFPAAAAAAGLQPRSQPSLLLDYSLVPCCCCCWTTASFPAAAAATASFPAAAAAAGLQPRSQPSLLLDYSLVPSLPCCCCCTGLQPRSQPSLLTVASFPAFEFPAPPERSGNETKMWPVYEINTAAPRARELVSFPDVLTARGSQ